MRHKKNADFQAKNAVFLDQNHFFRKSSKNVVTIMTAGQKDNDFVLTPLHGRPRGAHGAPSLAQKSGFFYATPT